MSVHRLGTCNYSVLCTLLIVAPVMRASSERNHPFSVTDDIALAKFGAVAMSPQRDLILVEAERGSVEDGKLHDELRVYDVAAVRKFVNASDLLSQPVPLWVVKESSGSAERGDTILSNVRWLTDGSGFAFLLQQSPFRRRLYLGLIAPKRVILLSPEGENVLGFDIRDQSHFVFTLASREVSTSIKLALAKPSRVGTGDTFYDMAFPDRIANSVQRGDLWSANGGSPRPVLESATGKPISLFEDGNDALSLSPNGRTLVTILALPNVPKQWEERFPPPFANDPYRLHSGSQDLNAAFGGTYVGEYVRIDLEDGTTTSLTNAPTARRSGWTEVNASYPEWSNDGSHVLLPGTFVGNQSEKEPRPCIAVVNIKDGTTECVRPLARERPNGYEEGYEVIDAATFAGGTNDEVILRHDDQNDGKGSAVRTYIRIAPDHWSPRTTLASSAQDTLTIRVIESYKAPPVLIGADSKTRRSRVIFDPNPELKNVAMGEPELYDWEDNAGRRWQGILYKPIGYRRGERYPLVIENHGFNVHRYIPSGGYTSAFVAQELASVGIAVLHMRDCAGRGTLTEGPCNVEGYRSAVESLAKDGVIDSSRVGIIGFSRTVFYVLEALTSGKVELKAASITDGVTMGYMNYLTSVDQDRAYVNEQLAMIGGAPFGLGLRQWIMRSPDFNLDQVRAPLRIVARTGDGVVEMWEPYALLEAMQRPVDLIILNSTEHVISDPRVRLAAQGGNVDWFRFWLQGYEDPSPTKTDQYTRWRKMRALNGD